MYRHLFWDLGGTLVDTYPALDAALADVVRQHGGEVALPSISRLTRRSTGEAVAELSRQFGIDEQEFEDANATLKRRWQENPAPAMPGAHAIMADVTRAGGLNLVVTHRDRKSARSLIDGLGLIVDDVICTSDGYPRKPDPAMYVALLERHSLETADCLGVGDRALDAQAAVAAGIDAMMLTSPYAPTTDDARHEVTSLDELRPLLALSAS